jgi:hypothetical protein
MVVGDSGTKLSPPINPQQNEQKNQILRKLGVPRGNFFSSSEFAYALFERQPHKAWLIHMVSLDGNTKQSFTLKGKRLERIGE